MSDLKVISNQTDALRITNGMESKSILHNVTYDELKKTFGEPVINRPSSDSKVNVEWVFMYKGNPFSLYDYQTSSLKTNRKWYVNGETYAADFLKEVRTSLKEKTNKEFTHGIY